MSDDDVIEYLRGRDRTGSAAYLLPWEVAPLLTELDRLRAELAEAKKGRAGDRPRVVCLCGSTRFKDAFNEANFRESRAGRIVLTVGWFSHADNRDRDLPADAKVAADELHLRKINMADEVLILNVGNYIGESTRREIAYARTLGKPIRWLEEPAP